MLRGFLKDRAGNFGIMTALLIVPIIGVAGLAVDFTNALTVKAKLQGAGDAAALAAIAGSSPGMQAAFAMQGDGTIPIAQEDAKAFFRGQLQHVTGYRVDSIDASIVKSGKSITSVVNYKATVPTYLAQILGQPIVTVAGHATASYEVATYRNFYLLLDNTPSMGIAAAQSDIDTLTSATQERDRRVYNIPNSKGCAFACHIRETMPDGSVREDKNDNYNIAINNRVTTRIDVVATATARLLQEATKNRGNNTNLYRMGVYTFGKSAENMQLQEVVAPTTDLDTAAATAKANVNLMTIPEQGYYGDRITNFDTAFTQLTAKLGRPGTGTDPSSPQKIIYLVSDGVGDSDKSAACTKRLFYDQKWGPRCQEPIDTTVCDTLKKQGFTIAVLYTTYLPLKNDWYTDWISPFQSEIGQRMKACSSPGLYFEATTQGIDDAMTALFQKIVAMPRLIN